MGPTRQLEMPPHMHRSRTCIQGFYFSCWMRTIYLTVILLATIGIIWSLLHFGTLPSDLWFVYLEALVGIFAILDIFLRLYLIHPSKFVKQTSNWIDIVLVILSTGAMALALHGNDLLESIEGLGSEVLMLLRDLALFARIFLFLRHQKAIQDSQTELINLN